MHELSILKEVIRIVENTVVEQKLNKVASIVLQVGELSGVLPEYLDTLYPAAAYKTSMEGTSLKVEIIPGDARCFECETVFNVVKNDATCPNCKAKSYEVISGRDFLLKEIIAN